MEISAQVSLYPLGQSDLAPAIEAVWKELRSHGLSPRPGAMSTLVQGNDQAVFAALRDAFAEATHYGGAVMVLTISNVCAVTPHGNRAHDAQSY
jgi:uncharacterized protein YqgV (UPF0045/DUF77 family)